MLREVNPDVDDLLTVLTDEIRSIRPTKREQSVHLPDRRIPVAASLFGDEFLDRLAERIASRVLSKLAPQAITEPAELSSTLV